MSPIKVDLHLHTVYSGDSLIKPRDLVKFAKKKGLNGVAITDHGSLKGYNILKKEGKHQDLLLIPGMEIETHIGEVIALFIEEEPKFKDNDFHTIVEEIRENNGLIVIPHPFDFLRPNHLKTNLLNDGIIKKYIDGIEIMNSRIIIKSCIKKARKFNEKYNLFETGGSDAHTLKEIGNGYTLITETADDTLDGIRESLLNKKSKSCGRLSSPLVHAKTVINKFQKGLYF